MLYLPPYIGAFGEGGDTYVNGPSMENRGVEILLTYRNSLPSGFNYSITGNIATFKNKITELPVRYLRKPDCREPLSCPFIA